MTIAELLGNEELRNREFPVTAERIFFGHAGVCPLPARVADAVGKAAVAGTLHDQEQQYIPHLVAETRQRAAELLGAGTDEVALVGPTSLGLSFVAGGLDWKPGDSIVVYGDDYPSNVYPWTILSERGVEVRYVRSPALGEITPTQVLSLVDKSTRLVALASCHFISGYRLDYQSIGKALHDVGVAFCVDGIQTLGAFPTTVEHIDFLAADAHKWMLGPCAAGLFYVSKEWHERLRPTTFGWNNVECPEFVASEEIQFSAGAHRYEAGSYNLLGTVGLNESLKMILSLGVDSIAAELLRKRRFMFPELQKRGYTILNSETEEINQSGIVSFYKPTQDMRPLWSKLEEKGMILSLRTGRDGQNYIRISAHYYNTDEEILRVLEQL
jgi:cysteine desulfurase/selenocysteine lyase